MKVRSSISTAKHFKVFSMILSVRKQAILIWVVTNIFVITTIYSQEAVYYYPVANFNLHVTLDLEACHDCELSGWTQMECDIWYGATFSPEGLFYGLTGTANQSLNQVDLATNSCELIMVAPDGIPWMMGMVAVGGGIFYTMAWMSDIVYRWDTNTETVTIVGSTGYPCWSDLGMSNGSIYYITRTFGNPNTASVMRLNTTTPSASTQMAFFDPTFGIFTVSATTDPDVLMVTETFLAEDGIDLYRLNIFDGSFTYECNLYPGNFGPAWPNLTSILEYDLYPDQPLYIDLDCDDSSGAVEADFNSLPFDCNSDGSHIIDIDPRIRSDARIDEMTVLIADPIPDAPDEILDIGATVDGITVTGLGTTMLTLDNTGGASLNDFLDQLDKVVYLNNSFDITEGLRTIEVRFSSISGAESNIARAFIPVQELPVINVDLGPDIIICEGASAVLSANIPGMDYIWSTGEDTEEITVSSPGDYSVTVSHPSFCPNRDTITVTAIPNIQVWLTGDTITCTDEEVQLIITTDAAFPIDVTVTPEPGDPFVIEDISASATYTDFPIANTEYYITNVSPDQPACVIIADPEQTIEIHPHYWDGITTAWLCPGDSIQLGNMFYSEAGFYDVYLETIYGCDSLVELQIFALPAENIFIHYNTCDPAEAGTFLSYLPNANGCDTVVHTIYSLLPIDTTILEAFTCRLADTGISTDTLTNQFGCDSFLVTTTLYDPPQDTTFLIQHTCDSAATGVFTQLLTGSTGCDSLVVTTMTIPEPDTTILMFTSCDATMVGITEALLNGADGCDSLVISQTVLISNDTTLVFSSSCDSANLGTFITSFPLPGDCDSIVITQVDFSLADSTFLSEGSCFANDTGQFLITLTNQFGCDSFVFRSVHLLPSDDTQILLSSCFPQDTGLFIQNLINQWGCDSIVTTLVSLLPSHSTSLASTTCDIDQAGQFITLLQNQFGCDSMVTLIVEYLEPDTTLLYDYTCESLEVGVVETLHQNSYGCDSLVILSTQLYPLPQVIIQSLTNYNGYDVSCFGGNDGSLLAGVTGIPAFDYIWSTGFNQALLQGIVAGSYAVTVIDGNGCVSSDDWNVTEPLPLEIALQVSEPECFENELGTILIDAQGGVGPYQYSQDSISFSDDPLFENLGDGLYKLFVLDQNDCLASAIIGVHIPLPVSVDLGDNQVLGLGDSALITALVNVPYALLDSISWSGENIHCDTCLQQFVSPIITSVYQIEVINIDGCRAEDEMTITVVKNDDIYIPNVFSPNGDGINDFLQISTGSYIREIVSFEIFDRWGNQVFQQSHLDPADSQLSWDGTFRGQRLNPAVYAYRLVVKLKDGTSTLKFGDITLVR